MLEVDERSYPYFQELFRRSAAVRDWLEWNEEETKFKNVLNFNEYFQQFRNGQPLATASAMVTTEQ